MKIGNRIYYNQNGEIIFETGEREGDVLPNLENEVINYIDQAFGTLQTHRNISVDVENKTVIMEEILQEVDPMIEYIKELEKQLGIEQSQIPNFGL